MIKWTLYKHERCWDVAICPIHIVHCPNYIKVKVVWYNIHAWRNNWGDPVCMNMQQKIKIPNNKIKEWRPLDARVF